MPLSPLTVPTEMPSLSVKNTPPELVLRAARVVPLVVIGLSEAPTPLAESSLMPLAVTRVVAVPSASVMLPAEMTRTSSPVAVTFANVMLPLASWSR